MEIAQVRRSDADILSRPGLKLEYGDRFAMNFPSVSEIVKIIAVWALAAAYGLVAP
jgi:hypothetical protein